MSFQFVYRADKGAPLTCAEYDANLRESLKRSNHVGTQPASTISDLYTTVEGYDFIQDLIQCCADLQATLNGGTGGPSLVDLIQQVEDNLSAQIAALEVRVSTLENDYSDLLAEINSVSVQLASKAPINSPVFTGDPRAPTPSSTDNDTSIATTAWVRGQLNPLNTTHAFTINHLEPTWGANSLRPRENFGTTGPTGNFAYFGATGNTANTNLPALFLSATGGFGVGKGTNAGTGLSSVWLVQTDTLLTVNTNVSTTGNIVAAGDVVADNVVATNNLASASVLANTATFNSGEINNDPPNNSDDESMPNTRWVRAAQRSIMTLDQPEGLTLSYVSSSVIGINAGAAVAGSGVGLVNNRDLAILPSNFTKNLGGVWAVGSGNGMRAPGSGAVSSFQTWHIFIIKDPTTQVVDIMADQSATGANIPNTFIRRRIGSVLTGGGSNIGPFLQKGNRFYWQQEIQDVFNSDDTGSNYNVPTGTLYALSVPSGVSVTVILTLYAGFDRGLRDVTYLSAYAYHPDVDGKSTYATGSVATSSQLGTFGQAYSVYVKDYYGAGYLYYYESTPTLQVDTDTSGRVKVIRWRCFEGDPQSGDPIAARGVSIVTFGWIDPLR